MHMHMMEMHAMSAIESHDLKSFTLKILSIQAGLEAVLVGLQLLTDPVARDQDLPLEAAQRLSNKSFIRTHV
jgi:hypothetical protein